MTIKRVEIKSKSFNYQFNYESDGEQLVLSQLYKRKLIIGLNLVILKKRAIQKDYNHESHPGLAILVN
jgi:hypothetical protein